ncbi:unnamed protein product [Lepeophtheirus salmonis]|uniref:(salmon louse) hypothetical protein n=1 Tax=Lepeophtheirus salmonis TaxID=72036 RepID=A0A7R8CU14_LEPSM|nr:unnamed protein product [Lepeophtheirus salmonis]CAF2894387.1 unnamed protein product [Lepeophtheirus salmonis]
MPLKPLKLDNYDRNGSTEKRCLSLQKSSFSPLDRPMAVDHPKLDDSALMETVMFSPLEGPRALDHSHDHHEHSFATRDWISHRSNLYSEHDLRYCGMAFSFHTPRVYTRVGMSLTTLLALTAMFGAVRSNVPKVSYLILTDGALYKLENGQAPTELFPTQHNVACLAHTSNNICDKINDDKSLISYLPRRRKEQWANAENNSKSRF